jgi:hypothetical protein
MMGSLVTVKIGDITIYRSFNTDLEASIFCNQVLNNVSVLGLGVGQNADSCTVSRHH